MEWKEVSVYTTSQGIDIISGYLIEQGIRGVMVEDAADFEEFLADTTPRWDYIDESVMQLKDKETNVKCYLPDTIQGLEQFNQIKSGLSALRAENPEIDLGRLEVETTLLDEEEWSTAWKKYYHPVKIGKKLVVVPCWEEYTLSAGEVKVTLDPGMAFGTGTHETTRLCMQLLEECVTDGSEVLDIGTGSGILAITALLLSAKKAVGVDIDELAVKVAGENAALNGVSDRLSLYCGDLTEKITGKYDIVCANIVADVIIRLSSLVRQFMKPDGILLVSGIIEERSSEVLAALKSEGFSVVRQLNENGWVSIQLS